MVFLRLCALTLVVGLCSGSYAAGAKKPATVAAPAGYKAAIVVDAATGDVLFEDRADAISPPASMTKLMTFAVLHDRLNSGGITLDTPVRITKEDAKMGGTTVFLDARETFPVEELIYAMMVQSANDAAHALARAAAGSRNAFVELMNAKARDLGMTQTTFRSPHGLPPSNRKVAEGDLSSPRDFARLARHLLAHTDVLKYSSVLTRDFGLQRSGGPYAMKNHNQLLGKVAGVDGLKTGYTDTAGYCLTATAQRRGQRVIAIIMGSLGPKGQRDYGRSRDVKAIELIERGFAALPAVASAPVLLDPAAKPAPIISIPAGPPPASPAPTVKFSIPKK